MKLTSWVRKINGLETSVTENIKGQIETDMYNMEEKMKRDLATIPLPIHGLSHPKFDAEPLDGNTDVAPFVTSLEHRHGHKYNFRFGLDGSQAKFVEYGTGIDATMFGEPHPDLPEDDYTYDENGHGTNGWFYHGAEGKWIRTWGMPAGLVVYRAKEAMREQLKRVKMFRGLL